MTQPNIEELMVKVTDETASPAEREALMTHLVDHPELRRELEAHQALVAVTQGWVQRLNADLAEDRSAAQPISFWTQRLALVSMMTGLLGLIGFSIHQAFSAPDMPTWLTVAMGLFWVGSTLFFISALLWKLNTRKHDPYREVIR